MKQNSLLLCLFLNAFHNMSETIYFHLKIIGVILIALSLIHVVFPKYFNWKEELSRLSLINQELMKVHTFFIAVVVFLIGVLCLHSTHDLVHTDFGRTISLGIGFFWCLRLITQFVGYSGEVWRGKRFETVVHIIFTILWIYLSLIFLWNGILNFD